MLCMAMVFNWISNTVITMYEYLWCDNELWSSIRENIWSVITYGNHNQMQANPSIMIMGAKLVKTDMV